MKTAVQELFSKLEIEHPNLFNTNTIEGRQFVNDYYPFLEMEKQQIIDARVNGVCEGIDIGYKPITEDISKKHEIYYNETFKK